MGQRQNHSCILPICIVRILPAWSGHSNTISGLSLPQSYDDAEYTLLRGTTVNSTHWTLTAKCTGCTSYQANDGSEYVLNGTGITQFAWAQGTTPVTDPSNNASAFNVHLAFGKWNHDLNAARSPNFNTWVSSNLLSAPAETSSAVVVVTSAKPTIAPPASTSKPASTLATSVVAAPKPSGGSAKVPASCSGAGAAVFSVRLTFLYFLICMSTVVLI